MPADPAVPVPPPAPQPSTIDTTLAGVSAVSGSGSGADFLLSQNPVPAVPGGQPGTFADVNALNTTQYLLPQNFMLSAPDQGTLYGVAPGGGNASFIDEVKGAHALWHGGLGKLSEDQLGQPLPGTAPPPGTAIPPGVVDYLPDPAPPVLPPAPPPAG
jgi:hypothetical protein